MVRPLYRILILNFKKIDLSIWKLIKMYIKKTEIKLKIVHNLPTLYVKFKSVFGDFIALLR